MMMMAKCDDGRMGESRQAAEYMQIERANRSSESISTAKEALSPSPIARNYL